LGDVHLGHLPTPDTGKTDNVVKKNAMFTTPFLMVGIPPKKNGDFEGDGLL